jgi:hypothetical protein
MPWSISLPRKGIDGGGPWTRFPRLMMLLELAPSVLVVGLLAPGAGKPFPVGERPPLGAWAGERELLGAI